MLEKEKENKNAHLSVFHLGALGIKNLKIKLKRPRSSNRFSLNRCSPQRREPTLRSSHQDIGPQDKTKDDTPQMTM